MGFYYGYSKFQKLILVQVVDTKGFENLSVPILSSTTPDKQKNACLPPNVPANPSTHQKIESYLVDIKSYVKAECISDH